MAALEPTPELLAAARRAAGRDWTFGPNDSPRPTDPHLRQLVDAGLAVAFFAPASRLRDDYWTLTPNGRKWLAEHEKGGAR